MELMIRPVRAGDAAAVLAFSRCIGAETRNLTFGPAGIPQTLEQETAYLTALETSPDVCMLLAFDGDELAATVQVARISPKARLAHRAGGAGRVKESHWGCGIATQLLTQCLEKGRAMGCTVLELEVLTTNAAAIRLYEKLGFRAIGRYDKFFQYGDGTTADALLMNRYE